MIHHAYLNESHADLVSLLLLLKHASLTSKAFAFLRGQDDRHDGCASALSRRLDLNGMLDQIRDRTERRHLPHINIVVALVRQKRQIPPLNLGHVNR